MKKLLILTFTFLLASSFIFQSCDSKTKRVTVNKEPKERKYKKDISDPTNTLSRKIETLELQYIPFGCACANWIETDIYKKVMKNENETLGDKTIFIEPAEKALELPEYFDLIKHKIVVKGQFYVKPDFPKGTEETEETGVTFKKAPVFRYTELTIKNLK